MAYFVEQNILQCRELMQGEAEMTEDPFGWCGEPMAPAVPGILYSLEENFPILYPSRRKVARGTVPNGFFMTPRAIIVSR